MNADELKVYRLAQLKIEAAHRSKATELDLAGLKLIKIPDSIGYLTRLRFLDLSNNQLTKLPKSFERLFQLETLYLYNNDFRNVPDVISKLMFIKDLELSGNQLISLPEWIGQISSLSILRIYNCQLKSLPDGLGQIENLETLILTKNSLTELPSSLANLKMLRTLFLEDNPLNLELVEANKQGFKALKLYLRAGPVISINEAKLILVGEGEVGKTCLMDALLDNEWQEHSSTHGIEIQHINVTLSEYSERGTDPMPEELEHLISKIYMSKGDKAKLFERVSLLRAVSAFKILTESKNQIPLGTEITLNAWDFGGQRVYRPTHQLFFSAPAVYLVVWKPREGSQAGQVKEWIQLVKRREPSAKILVVATHGGPQ